jgi:adenylate cyclase class IV
MAWKELWLNNYKGIGDTAELEKSLKTQREIIQKTKFTKQFINKFKFK